MSLNRGVTQGYMPTARKSPQQGAQQPSITATAILRLYSQLGPWGKVAEALGVTRALVWKEAHGRSTAPCRLPQRENCHENHEGDAHYCNRSLNQATSSRPEAEAHLCSVKGPI